MCILWQCVNEINIPFIMLGNVTIFAFACSLSHLTICICYCAFNVDHWGWRYEGLALFMLYWKSCFLKCIFWIVKIVPFSVITVISCHSAKIAIRKKKSGQRFYTDGSVYAYSIASQFCVKLYLTIGQVLTLFLAITVYFVAPSALGVEYVFNLQKCLFWVDSV